MFIRAAFVAAVVVLATSCGAPSSSVELATGANRPVVVTQFGAVEGTREDGLAIFRGIPFAAPPVGDNRWKAPQPASRWEEVRQAKQFAPACFQSSGPMAGGVPQSESSEDCLYLNVWTPAKTSQEKLPVMVWIYGGGFSAGATATPLYSGEKLAQRGVVVVSVAYRVGPLGFLAHPELSAESTPRVSGNYGLLDQIAGLEWVKANIRAFGGDPSKVTIFGESAGGISVSMLAASPLAKGKFSAAISQSGGSFGANRSPPMPGENVQRLDQAEKAGAEFIEKLGGTIAAARARSAADVQAALRGGASAVSWPVMDGHVIPDDQYRLYEAGKYNDVPVLIGFNSDEGALFGGPVAKQTHDQSVKERYGPFADEILQAFPAASDDDATQASRDLATDVMFGWHTLAWARLQNKTGKSPVYFYYFDQKPPYPQGHRLSAAKGAPHAAELPYVFGHLAQQTSIPWRDEDQALAAAIVGYWTNFAKTGNPNGDALTDWPKFATSNESVMIFRETPQVGTLPDPQHFDVIERYMAWRRSQEGTQQ